MSALFWHIFFMPQYHVCLFIVYVRQILNQNFAANVGLVAP